MRKPSKIGWWIALGISAAAVYFGAKLGLSGATLLALFTDGLPSLGRYLSPDFTNSERLGTLAWETVAMGGFGTLLTFALGFPLTAWASRNMSPNTFAYRVSREILSFFRAMPDVLLALVFVQGFGVGPFAGSLALGVHSTGFFCKVLSESIERVDPRVYEGLQACGATRLQIVRFGAWPSISREVSGYTLYILERNIRVATTLGLVGAGGIGSELLGSLRTFQTAKAAACVWVIFALVLVVEAVSNLIRRRLV